MLYDVMGMFTMPKPRRFNHPYIYVDERKERLNKYKESAGGESGCSSSSGAPGGSARDKLLEQTTGWHRRERSHKPIKNGVLVVAIAALLFFLYVMMGGLMQS